MTRLSIEASFAWAQRFVAREWGLLLPVALAFIAFPPLAVGLLVPPDMQQVLTTPPINDLARVEAAVTWLLPTMLALLAIAGIGGLSITALALTPRMSVGEAIRLAVRRLPVLAGSFALLFVGLVIFTIVETYLLLLLGVGLPRLQAIVSSLLIVATIALLVRMTPLVAVVVDRNVGPIAAIRQAWFVGRGAGWKMLLALLLYNVAAMVLILALGTAIDASILLAARFGGWPDLGPPLVAVVDRTFTGVAIGGSYVLGAAFYRQLAGSSSGI